MAAMRLPGFICRTLGVLELDAGTLCRNQSPSPGFLGIKPAKRLNANRHRHQSIHQRSGSLTALDFEVAAGTLNSNIDPRLLHAFADVESGGRSGLGPAGLPVIAYEGHWFRKFTKKQFDKDYPLLSYPYVCKAGSEWRENNANQETAWKTLNSAIELDKSAALQSCSWGMFQVMGFNFEVLGYATVVEFVSAMYSELGQLDAFVRYCKKKRGMIDAMINKEYALLAFLYNGKDFGDYDKRIKKAYKRHGGV